MYELKLVSTNLNFVSASLNLYTQYMNRKITKTISNIKRIKAWAFKSDVIYTI